MKINHNSVFKIDIIKKHFLNTENVDLEYVCTSELHSFGSRGEVYIKKFGKSYFGREYVGFFIKNNDIKVCSAKNIEDLDFLMYYNEKDNSWNYSRDRNDQLLIGNSIINGGRFCPNETGLSIKKIRCKVKNGIFLES